MAEYLVQSESLTAVADEIRTLSGTTDAMGLEAMANHVGDANDTVDTQTDLISQIATALEGKAGASTETCTVTITVDGTNAVPAKFFNESTFGGVTCVDSNGEPYAVPFTEFVPTATGSTGMAVAGYYTLTCRCDTLIAIGYNIVSSWSLSTSDEITIINDKLYCLVCQTPSEPGEYAITFTG